MRKQRVNMLWSLLFCGALSMTQTAQTAEIKRAGFLPYSFCFICTPPMWSYR